MPCSCLVPLCRARKCASRVIVQTSASPGQAKPVGTKNIILFLQTRRLRLTLSLYLAGGIEAWLTHRGSLWPVSEIFTGHLRIVRQKEYTRDGGQGDSCVFVNYRLEPNQFSEHAAVPLLERENVPTGNLP